MGAVPLFSVAEPLFGGECDRGLIGTGIMEKLSTPLKSFSGPAVNHRDPKKFLQ
jgi:hypothetical protein